MKIIALGGSVRSHIPSTQFLIDTVRACSNLEDYLGQIRAHTASSGLSSRLLSNSEILAGISLMGAKSCGSEVDFYPLLKLFQTQGKSAEQFSAEFYGIDPEIHLRNLLKVDEKELANFSEKMESSDAVVFVSPVYFGDRSSVANKFIQLAAGKMWLEGKVAGACSVGAKRNGGQETTNIFFLYEALNLGAYVVGNGPKTSQYGGTAWAGDKGVVLNDSFGIDTSFGTGVRVAETARIVSHMNAEYGVRPARITVLSTMDTPERRLKKTIGEFVAKAGIKFPQAEFRIVELIDGDIDRCVACNICPIPAYLPDNGDTDSPYACIIRKENDSMSRLRDELLASDGLLLAGMNLRDMSQVQYRYQAFMERTRFIRRNDFELTNTPIAGLLLSEIGGHANPIHNLKVMTSFMRHNGIMTRPITRTIHEGKVLESGQADFEEFVKRTAMLREARNHSPAVSVSYEADGYSDTRLDPTSACRR